ncbi:AAA domain-containing protein [Halobaculum sp. MBLA0147]|uniref:AAA domain-containing protein n=1 Tax=Halobaculum sp. MBLA0147 TaxID=3079934 RepID=UPI003524661C
MIDELVDTWRLADARLFAADLDRDDHSPTDVPAALETALDHLAVETDDPAGYAVPLFDATTPTPTSEYVVYRPEASQVGWLDTGFGVSGTVRFTDADDHARTELGHRLRFWVPAERPGVATTVSEDDLPPRHVDPVDPLDEAATTAWFDEVAAAVRDERDRERAGAREAYERRDVGRRRRDDETVGPFRLAGAVRDGAASGRGGVDASRAGGDGSRDGDSRHGESRHGDSRYGDADERATGAAYRYRLADVPAERVDLRAAGLFAGDWCLADADGEGFPVPVRLAAVEDPRVTIHPDWDAVSDAVVDRLAASLADGVDLWLAPLVTPVPYERRLDGVAAVRETPAKRALVAGRDALSFSANRFDLPETAVDLDRHQHDALVWADGADDLALLHGPPGTGKTRTLTATVLAAVEKGQSVLVTAHSNQAVDNLLVGESTPGEPAPDTLHAAAERGDLSLARVGRNSSNPVVERSYVGESVAAADVVAATTSGAAQFDRSRFDLAVVDEATQASRAATLIVLARAEKLVLAGDHRQLPPYAAGESAATDRLRPSLFETLLDRYGADAAVSLRRQYRMHPAIAAFPSEQFYDGWLETAADAERTVGDLPPLAGVDVAGGERPHGTESYANDREAAVVCREVRRLLEAGLDPGSIAVITPYSGQRAVCRDRLGEEGLLDGSGVAAGSERDTAAADRYGTDTDDGTVAVDTVDAFQGSERAAVVVSFVRSNPSAASGFLTFPAAGPRRLNVALTRARRRLVLVGDWARLGTVGDDRDHAESAADVYAALADHLRDRDAMRSAE